MYLRIKLAYICYLYTLEEFLMKIQFFFTYDTNVSVDLSDVCVPKSNSDLDICLLFSFSYVRRMHKKNFIPPPNDHIA